MSEKHLLRQLFERVSEIEAPDITVNDMDRLIFTTEGTANVVRLGDREWRDGKFPIDTVEVFKALRDSR